MTDPAFGSLPRYLTANAQTSEITTTITATGTLNASLNVEVGSQLSGQVTKLLVDFNDSVVKGQPLAELDQSSFAALADESRAALESAKAGVKIAEAHLQRAMISAREIELQKAVLAARADSARVHFETAVREARRKAILSDHGVTSASETQDAGARRDAAAAGLREAEAIAAAQTSSLDGARADVSRAEAELDGARNVVRQAEAKLQNALIDLNRTLIRAPIDGVIVGRNLTQGQTLASTLEARTLFAIAGDLRHMEILARVDESDIGKIAVGQKAEYTVDAFPDQTFQATVRQIRKAPQVLQNVVTYVVVLTAENPDRTLLPGMTALAKITVRKALHPTTVPLAALRFNPESGAEAKDSGDDRPSIWILNPDGKLKRIFVTTGEDDGEKVSVTTEELKPDDKIVVGELEPSRRPSSP